METALLCKNGCVESEEEAVRVRLPTGYELGVCSDSLWDFRQFRPDAELVRATPRQKVIWDYWRAGYERSFHGEPAVVELGEIS